MSWKHVFARQDMETLLAEMAGKHQLRRFLGPVSLTSLVTEFVIDFLYGGRHSCSGRHLLRELTGKGLSGSDAPLGGQQH